jgi:hypothetical protein
MKTMSPNHYFISQIFISNYSYFQIYSYRWWSVNSANPLFSSFARKFPPFSTSAPTLRSWRHYDIEPAYTAIWLEECNYNMSHLSDKGRAGGGLWWLQLTSANTRGMKCSVCSCVCAVVMDWSYGGLIRLKYYEKGLTCPYTGLGAFLVSNC